MHILTTTSASLDDIAEPVDLRQQPAEMVALSFTDSDPISATLEAAVCFSFVSLDASSKLLMAATLGVKSFRKARVCKSSRTRRRGSGPPPNLEETQAPEDDRNVRNPLPPPLTAAPR